MVSSGFNTKLFLPQFAETVMTFLNLELPYISRSVMVSSQTFGFILFFCKISWERMYHSISQPSKPELDLTFSNTCILNVFFLSMVGSLSIVHFPGVLNKIFWYMKTQRLLNLPDQAFEDILFGGDDIFSRIRWCISL